MAENPLFKMLLGNLGIKPEDMQNLMANFSAWGKYAYEALGRIEAEQKEAKKERAQIFALIQGMKNDGPKSDGGTGPRPNGDGRSPGPGS